MGLFLFFLITEVLTLFVLWQHLYTRSAVLFYVSLTIHSILSIWLWILFIQIETYGSFFDTARHIWLLMNLAGIICAVAVPRLILVIFHFSGKLVKLKSRTHIGWLTNTGLIIAFLISSIIGLSTFRGRFNFKTEEVTIKISGLNQALDGLRIVQLSDMHLSTFYKNEKMLVDVMDKVNSYEPDLILNTGDFVSYGWREFGRNDTILSLSKSRYGNFAVMGNHDFGTYHPSFTEADKDSSVMFLNNLVSASGYKVLNDEYSIVNIGGAKLALIGVITKGRHPGIIHGDLGRSTAGLDSVDLKILLTHDPNHWAEAVTGKSDIDISLSGHTHGMQMGIITKNLKWSPAKYFYPHWHGLYSEGKQFHYVNRGLGVLSIPFRIWMPPEITLITIKKE